MANVKAARDDLLRAFTVFVDAVVAEAEAPAAKASEADKLAEKWGEAVSRKTACKIMDRSYGYLVERIESGDIACAPDGRVLVRSIAGYLYRGAPKPKQKERSRWYIDPRRAAQ